MLYSYSYVLMNGGFMRTLKHYWINVFTTEQDQGNPLPVFVLDAPLSDRSMQAIAQMMNQSETVFIHGLDFERPMIRLFTPAQELPFAGHPIVGALAVLKTIFPNRQFAEVEVPAGHVAIKIDEQTNIVWLKTPRAPEIRASTLDQELSSQLLGVPMDKIASLPIWVNVGSEQLLVELTDFASVDAIQMNADVMREHASLYPGREITYVWAREGDEVYVRFMYLQNGAVLEDPGTGSACANLGGLQVAQGLHDFSWRLRQGCLLGRENILFLNVTSDNEIWIGGQNRLMGEGVLYWSENQSHLSC